MAEVEEKFIVFNIKDMHKYLVAEDFETIGRIQGTINCGRIKEGKPINSYWTINLDEPYAREIVMKTLQGEDAKQELKDNE